MKTVIGVSALRTTSFYERLRKVGYPTCRVENVSGFVRLPCEGASLQLSQQPLRFLLRQSASHHLFGQSASGPTFFGHIPSSLRSSEHRRPRRRAHLKSLPSRGRFCYCYRSVGLAHWLAQSSTALCVQHP